MSTAAGGSLIMFQTLKSCSFEALKTAFPMPGGGEIQSISGCPTCHSTPTVFNLAQTTSRLYRGGNHIDVRAMSDRTLHVSDVLAIHHDLTKLS